MPNLNCKKTWLPLSRHIPTVAGVSLSILLVTVGALVLSSCATSPQGVAREVSVYRDVGRVLAAGLGRAEGEREDFRRRRERPVPKGRLSPRISFGVRSGCGWCIAKAAG